MLRWILQLIFAVIAAAALRFLFFGIAMAYNDLGFVDYGPYVVLGAVFFLGAVFAVVRVWYY
jgi:hypothetical protein